MRYIFIVAAAFLFSSCASVPGERVDELADKLIMISRKAESEVRYADNALSAEELKAYVAEENPELAAYFQGYALDFQIQGQHVVALLCDVNSRFTIAEDSACTTQIDRKFYTRNEPCGFTLSAADICTHQ